MTKEISNIIVQNNSSAETVNYSKVGDFLTSPLKKCVDNYSRYSTHSNATGWEKITHAGKRAFYAVATILSLAPAAVASLLHSFKGTARVVTLNIPMDQALKDRCKQLEINGSSNQKLKDALSKTLPRGITINDGASCELTKAGYQRTYTNIQLNSNCLKNHLSFASLKNCFYKPAVLDDQKISTIVEAILGTPSIRSQADNMEILRNAFATNSKIALHIPTDHAKDLIVRIHERV